MTKQRLDQQLVRRGLIETRSHAENLIKLGKVQVDGQTIKKPSYVVSASNDLTVQTDEDYVSRAALKLSSVAERFKLDFHSKVVLDVGSSTGGFTDYALQHGAEKVVAVDVGTDQLHPKLQHDRHIELHEKTDIRDFAKTYHGSFDIVVVDVSFISLRQVLPSVISMSTASTAIVAMCKPQFEVGDSAKHKGVIKNEKLRRDTMKDFEGWLQQRFVLKDKADSAVHGSKGNQERFYLLQAIQSK